MKGSSKAGSGSTTLIRVSSSSMFSSECFFVAEDDDPSPRHFMSSSGAGAGLELDELGISCGIGMGGRYGGGGSGDRGGGVNLTCDVLFEFFSVFPDDVEVV